MKDALYTLVFTMIACQIAVQLCPERESAKKGVKLLCGLAVLLTLLSPLRMLFEGAGELGRAAEAYFAKRESDTESEDAQDPYARTARAILTCVSDITGTDSAELTLVTGEDGEVRELQLFLGPCSYSSRAEAEAVLEEAYGLPVSIFAAGSERDDGKNQE